MEIFEILQFINSKHNTSYKLVKRFDEGFQDNPYLIINEKNNTKLPDMGYNTKWNEESSNVRHLSWSEVQ